MDEFIDYDASHDQQLQAMVSGVEAFVSSIHRSGAAHWLSLLGTSGAGKTMLAERIIRWAKKYQAHLLDPRYDPEKIVKYRKCVFLSWSWAMNQMIDERDYSWIPDIKKAWIVCLDDIGTGYDKHQALSAGKLYEIFEARRGLWTVITANLSAEEIGNKLDPRIASRLFRDGSDLYDVDVVDYNVRQFKLKKAQQPRLKA